MSDLRGLDVRMEPMSNLSALEAFLSSHDVPATQAALARSLASAIDADPDVGLAALAKEYRALLKDMTSDVGSAETDRDLFAEVGN